MDTFTTLEVLAVVAFVRLILTYMPVALCEVILGNNAEIISPKQRLKRLLFIRIILYYAFDMGVLDVL